MNTIKLKYNFINIAVLLVTLALYVIDFKDATSVFLNESLPHIAVIIATVFLVHAIKLGRLYLALYGSEIRFTEYFKVYCKVTPVSIILPYKLGEFFRMYCYGKTLNNMLKGIVIVLLDRFMDTIALVTTILFVWLFYGGRIVSFVYLLLIFLVSILLLYFSFPGVYHFWKSYILKSKATEKKLYALRILEKLNRIYKEIQSVSKGRGIVLYILSLIAWAVEIGSIALQISLFKHGQGNLSQILSNYLTAAMGSTHSYELNQIIFVSVIVMIVSYAAVKIFEILKGKQVRS